MLNRLPNQEAVKGIAMERGQFCNLRHAPFVHRQTCDLVSLSLGRDIDFRRAWQGQISQLMLDQDFPQ